MNQDEVFDRKGAAAFLKISPDLLDQLSQKGALPYCELPPVKGTRGKRLYLKSQLLETLRGYAVKAPGWERQKRTPKLKAAK